MATTVRLISYNLKTKAGWKYFLRGLWNTMTHSISTYKWIFRNAWRETLPNKSCYTYKKTKIWKEK